MGLLDLAGPLAQVELEEPLAGLPEPALTSRRRVHGILVVTGAGAIVGPGLVSDCSVASLTTKRQADGASRRRGRRFLGGHGERHAGEFKEDDASFSTTA